MRVTARFLAALAALSLLATACTGTGASRQSLIEILMIEADLSLDEATCVANAMYADPGLTEDEINRFSVIQEVEPGSDDEPKFKLYQNVADTAVRQCVS